jgi:hypothetical protein
MLKMAFENDWEGGVSHPLASLINDTHAHAGRGWNAPTPVVRSLLLMRMVHQSSEVNPLHSQAGRRNKKERQIA